MEPPAGGIALGSGHHVGEGDGGDAGLAGPRGGGRLGRGRLHRLGALVLDLDHERLGDHGEEHVQDALPAPKRSPVFRSAPIYGI